MVEQTRLVRVERPLSAAHVHWILGHFALSAYGEVIVFQATLRERGTEAYLDAGVFLYDLCTRTTQRIIQGESYAPDISKDGRFVAFIADAPEPEEADGFMDAYLLDRQTGIIALVSAVSALRPNAGARVQSAMTTALVTDDGRYVVFDTAAAGLVLGDNDDLNDVFAYDFDSRETTRISSANSEMALWPSMSSSGDIVAYIAWVSGSSQSFVFDRSTRQTTIIDVGSESTNLVVSGDGESVFVNSGAGCVVYDLSRAEAAPLAIQDISCTAVTSVSGDGRFVAFKGHSALDGDAITEDRDGVFVYDRANRLATRLDVVADGDPADGASWNPVISDHGRVAAFLSAATNLVEGETSGESNIYLSAIRW